MRNLSKDYGLHRLIVPVMILGVVIAIVGGYRTVSRQRRCAEIGARGGYVEAYIVPGRHGPDQCVCRGKPDEKGNVDMTVKVSVPLD